HGRLRPPVLFLSHILFPFALIWVAYDSQARRLTGIKENAANREHMEIFFTILIMTLVVSLSGVVTRVLPFQVPLPLMQIAIGALLAWPTFGLHVEFDPELFLYYLSLAAIRRRLENSNPRIW
ncbi:MAG: hypothetical protein ACLT2V_02175, partial [Escherichia coli]